MLSLQAKVEKFPIAGEFKISRGSKTEAVVIHVSLSSQGKSGQGESVPYHRYGESVESVLASIESLRPGLQSLERKSLQSVLPAGAARNAVDCAFWDLEAKISGSRAFNKAGLESQKQMLTAYTISLDTPEAMAQATAKVADRPLLKIKLGAEGGDYARIRAVREAAPSARLIADANEGWTSANLEQHLLACRESGFELIEQPLPANDDAVLAKVAHLVPLCADESVHGLATLPRLVGLYEFVNIKLDKTGGLTEALALKSAAKQLGFKIMVGCMVGTSLAMAPATILAGDADFVDLDGPLLLARDRDPGLRFEGSVVWPPSPSLWG